MLSFLPEVFRQWNTVAITAGSFQQAGSIGKGNLINISLSLWDLRTGSFCKVCNPVCSFGFTEECLKLNLAFWSASLALSFFLFLSLSAGTHSHLSSTWLQILSQSLSNLMFSAIYRQTTSLPQPPSLSCWPIVVPKSLKRKTQCTVSHSYHPTDEVWKSL